MLHINDLTYRIGGRTLLDAATVVVPSGHRVGLVGRNGSGKSTLFKLITGELTSDGGTIAVRPRARLGQVAQEAPDGSATLIATVLAADVERDALMAEAETAADPHRIADIHTRLADIDAHGAPARAAVILAGLGFDAAAQKRPLSEFSGGWRMRVALAATLFTRPELLLLDEPTNHLDLEATMWLEGYLATYPGTALIISHERTLLNSAVSEIIHLDRGKLVRYNGGYDRFERTRREKMVLQSKLQTRQLAERRRIEGFINRFRAQANKARQAQSRIKALERMEPIATVVEERTVSFSFPKPDPLSPPLLTLDDVSAGYEPGKPVLQNLNLRVDMEDRIGLLGANGNGKSTLIRLLAERLAPMEGKIRRSGKLKIAYFAQHQTEELDLKQSPLAHMRALMPMAIVSKVRAQLARFGFGQDKADTLVEHLSGGEKARLLFALMSRENPHIILLDEPTNHLDVDSREALIQALNEYDGAVILVSHDPHLIELTCDRLLLVADGGCQAYDGDLDDYRRLLIDQQRAARRSASGKNNGAGKSNGKSADARRKDGRRERAAKREQLAPLKKRVKNAETRMHKLEGEKERVQTRLADPALYDEGANPDAVTALKVELSDIQRSLAATEEAWVVAHDELENAQTVQA